MAEHVLMEKGPATMNVPPDKVQAYLDDGWTITDRKSVVLPLQAADVVDQPKANDKPDKPASKKATK